MKMKYSKSDVFVLPATPMGFIFLCILTFFFFFVQIAILKNLFRYSGVIVIDMMAPSTISFGAKVYSYLLYQLGSATLIKLSEIGVYK